MVKKSQALLLTVCLLLGDLCASARDLVHVFTSKGVYETYEDLWFKCLVLDRKRHQLSDASNTMYIEVVDPNDSIVSQDKYPVVDGECDGHLYIGDDWIPGEYRMYANTRNSISRNDTVLFPHRILVVRELPELPGLVPTHQPATVSSEEVNPYGGGLNMSVTLDTAAFPTRSKVVAHIRVTDKDGKPVQTKVALSIYDCLYRYRPSEIGLSVHCFADDRFGSQRDLKPFLADGVSSGVMRIGKKAKYPAQGQWINVYDVEASTGQFNLLETDQEGKFEVPRDFGMDLGRELIMKPFSLGNNPTLVLDRPFDMLDSVRIQVVDRLIPVVVTRTDNVDEEESEDDMVYSSRRTMRLDEVIVQGKTPNYTRRNKLYGYLDSIHAMRSGVWVCCLGKSPIGIGYINDYIKGYTHHPGQRYMPSKIYAPKRGETYEAIKYSGPSDDDYVVDIQTVTYEGDIISQEELLKEAGLFTDQGYSRPYSFRNWEPEEWFDGVDDIRNTLFWEPQAETDCDGTLDIVFYTSDIASTFIIGGYAYSRDGRYSDISRAVFEVH